MTPDNWQLPVFPDRLSRRRPVVAESLLPVHATAVYPIPDILATLDFFPWFPDRVPAVRTLREWAASTGAIIPVAVYPVVWLPTYPARVPRQLPVAPPSDAAPPPGALIVIAQRLAWMAKFPDRVPHRRDQQTSGAFWAIEPATIAGLPCVDLGLDELTTPALRDETLTSNALTGEGLGSPTLLNEDLC